jgi:hypothetical protein
MPTRFKTNSRKYFNQSPLPSGYENTTGTPNLTIPSCGIEDVDAAMFNLFDKEINVHCGGADSSEVKKVPVVFAAGEKWALLKRGRLLRDKNNTLILPLITIMRTDMNQSVSEDVVGRGINQQVGELVVRRRLDQSDRDYQRLINRLLIPNQDRLSESTSTSEVSSDSRKIGGLSAKKYVKDGALLTPDLTNNVYETIVVPTPQFYTAKYQVTVWTQFTQHANQVMERIFSSFLPQGQSWKLDTAKGYWFVAKVEDGSFAIETNFEDMSQQERYIKHTFSVSVPAYFFVSTTPGSAVPIKRYVSSVTINFDSGFEDPNTPTEPSVGYVLGSDDPTLPLDNIPNRTASQQSDGWRHQKIYPVIADMGSNLNPAENPARTYDVDTVVSSESLSNMHAPRGKVIKVTGRTLKGETSYSGASLDGLGITIK